MQKPTGVGVGVATASTDTVWPVSVGDGSPSSVVRTPDVGPGFLSPCSALVVRVCSSTLSRAGVPLSTTLFRLQTLTGFGPLPHLLT